MKNKRIFVGLDYFAPFFYLSGLSLSFEWLFHHSFHQDEQHQMFQFLSALSKKEIVYRMPFFSCVFKKLCLEQPLIESEIYQHTRLFQFKHSLGYLGFHQQMHHYQIAYICSRQFEEQLSILGPSKDLLTRIDIDALALWFYRSQVKPYPGKIRNIRFQQQDILHSFYGRDDYLWIEGDQGVQPEIIDTVEDLPWHLSKSLAFSALYHAF